MQSGEQTMYRIITNKRLFIQLAGPYALISYCALIRAVHL